MMTKRSNVTLSPVPRPQIADLAARREQARAMRLGSYSLVEMIGSGAFAEVWTAVKRGNDGSRRTSTVALKRFAPQPGRSRGRLNAIAKREVESLMLLRHPNIVSLIELIEDGGELAIAMAWIDGVTLRQFVRARAAATNKPLAAELLAHILLSIASALAHAHNRRAAGTDSGILHRDISAGNIMVTSEGHLMLTDFGISHLVSDDVQGFLRQGTPPYIAPEVMRDGAVALPQSDVYGLGIVLHELMTGQPYLAGLDFEQQRLLVADLEHVPELPPTDYPDWLIALHDRMLAPRPEQRATAAEVVKTVIEHCAELVHAPLELCEQYAKLIGPPRSGETVQPQLVPDPPSTEPQETYREIVVAAPPRNEVDESRTLDPEFELWWQRFTKYNFVCGVTEMVVAAIFVIIYLGVATWLLAGLVGVFGIAMLVLAGTVLVRMSHDAMHVVQADIPAIEADASTEQGTRQQTDDEGLLRTYRGVIKTRRTMAWIGFGLYFAWALVALLCLGGSASLVDLLVVLVPGAICNLLFSFRLSDFNPIPIWCHDDPVREARLREAVPQTLIDRSLAHLTRLAGKLKRVPEVRRFQPSFLLSGASYLAYGSAIAFFGFSWRTNGVLTLALIGLLVALVGLIIGRGYKFVSTLPRMDLEEGWEIALPESFGLLDHERAEVQRRARLWQDPVTQLGRREAFEHAFDGYQQWIRSLNGNRVEYSLLFVELSNLSEINRRYTRRVGERVLYEIGRRLEAQLTVELGDAFELASYDTSTFAILAKSTASGHISALAEHIEACISCLPFVDHHGAVTRRVELDITVSSISSDGLGHVCLDMTLPAHTECLASRPTVAA
jgi:serine/threonine protein kinase/GGDEF domain-containing protein